MQRTMSFSARQELAASLAERYREAKHPIKQKILDEFTAATGYHRKYAVTLLSRNAHKNRDTKERRKPRTYTAEVKDALVALRNISQKWTMPIKDWKAALNQFSIIFDGRI